MGLDGTDYMVAICCRGPPTTTGAVELNTSHANPNKYQPDKGWLLTPAVAIAMTMISRHSL